MDLICKLLTIGVSVKAKYDGEWFTGQLVAYNKEIDQWTIYFKEDDYTDYVIFPDNDITVQKIVLATAFVCFVAI